MPYQPDLYGHAGYYGQVNGNQNRHQYAQQPQGTVGHPNSINYPGQVPTGDGWNNHGYLQQVHQQSVHPALQERQQGQTQNNIYGQQVLQTPSPNMTYIQQLPSQPPFASQNGSFQPGLMVYPPYQPFQQHSQAQYSPQQNHLAYPEPNIYQQTTPHTTHLQDTRYGTATLAGTLTGAHQSVQPPTNSSFPPSADLTHFGQVLPSDRPPSSPSLLNRAKVPELASRHSDAASAVQIPKSAAVKKHNQQQHQANRSNPAKASARTDFLHVENSDTKPKNLSVDRNASSSNAIAPRSSAVSQTCSDARSQPSKALVTENTENKDMASQSLHTQVSVARPTQNENVMPGTWEKHTASSPLGPATPQTRTLAQVQIPRFPQSGDYIAPQLSYDAVKRRRSNEGHAIPVPASVTKLSHTKTLHSVVVPTPSPSSNPPPQLLSAPLQTVDNQAVLLHLADEYIKAAHNMASGVAASSASDEHIDTYQSLMATAMGCLESVLQNYRFSDPRKEARLRIRLASLMLDETENFQEAGDVLDKGIALCERSRLVHLKYATHHLSVRLLHQRNPAAALKTVDKLIYDVDALNLTAWTYAFRFLRISLGLQNEGNFDKVAILRQLQIIAQKADYEKKTAILIVASLIEALVHLRSGSADAVDLAQRSLTNARTHQLSSDMLRMPQIPTLMDCLDIACNTIHFNPEQVQTRLQQLHQKMDASSKDAGWSNDGRIWVSIGTDADQDLDLESMGIFKRLEDGTMALVMSWLTRSQAYLLSYLISGLVYGHKGNGDGRAEPYLIEGLKLCESKLNVLPQSVSSARSLFDWQMSKRVASRLQLIFEQCGRADWQAAHQSIHDFQAIMPRSGPNLDASSIALLTYLDAVCKQGRGELEAAQEVYQKPELTFVASSREVSAEQDIRVLATLNSILILRCINQHDQILADMLVTSVEDYCLKHHNKAILAAFYIIKATSEVAEGMIIRTKQYLQSAVQAARTSGSNQLLCVVMSLMSSLYFTNIVGDQAEKSMGASRSLAKKSHSDLWLAVTDGMLADTFELVGKREGAATARQEAAAAMAKIPQLVKDRIKTMYDDNEW